MLRTIRGLTLIELLFVILLLCILLSLSLPSFSTLVNQKKSDIVIKQVQQAVELGKVTAITDSETVTMCKSNNGAQCGGKWQDGIIVFSDHNRDRKINQDDELIRYITFPELDGNLSWRAFQNRQYLQFTPQGFTRYQNGSFVFCPNNNKAELARQLVINRTARARITIDSDGDGLREDATGAPIRC